MDNIVKRLAYPRTNRVGPITIRFANAWNERYSGVQLKWLTESAVVLSFSPKHCMTVKKKSRCTLFTRSLLIFFKQRLNSTVRNLPWQKYLRSYVTCCEKIRRLLLTAGGLSVPLMERITKSAAVPYKAIVSYSACYNEVFNNCSLLEIIRFGYGVIYKRY